MRAAETIARRPVLSVVLIATALSNLDQSIVGVALPTLREAFGAKIGLIRWVVLAYQLAIIVALLLAGRAVDVVGARGVFLAGLAVFTLSSVSCGLAASVFQLIGFRGVQGIGAAMLLAAGQALLTGAYPTGQRGAAMGYLHMAVAAGLMAGPTLGGFLIDLATWRAIFLVNVPLGCVALWVGCRRMPRVVRPFRTGPFLDFSVFRSWPLTAGLLAAFLVFIALKSNMFLVPFALQSVMGLSPTRAGLVMIAVPVTILVVAPFSGRLTDRIGPRQPATLGVGLVAASILLMAQLQSGSAVRFAILTLVLYGSGAGLFQAPNNAAVMTAAPVSARGMVSGLLALARSLGQVCGVALASTIWSWRQATYAQNPGRIDPLTGGLRDAFLVLAIVAIGATVLSWRRGGWRQ